MKTIFDKLDRFFSGKWNIAVFHEDKGRWILHPSARLIPYLKAENSGGRHILIQPTPDDQAYYLLADDLTGSLIQRHHMEPEHLFKPGRMVVETSPANYQVWIRASRPLALEEKRYWLNKLRSDPGADPLGRWGRCPSNSRNHPMIATFERSIGFW
jgi:hypothetical protein